MQAMKAPLDTPRGRLSTLRIDPKCREPPLDTPDRSEVSKAPISPPFTYVASPKRPSPDKCTFACRDADGNSRWRLDREAAFFGYRSLGILHPPSGAFLDHVAVGDLIELNWIWAGFDEGLWPWEARFVMFYESLTLVSDSLDSLYAYLSV